MEEIAILVIEDNKDHQLLFLMQLTRAGFGDVKIVESASEGLDACRQRPRDVVIADSGVIPDQRAKWLAQVRETCQDARVIAYSAGVHREPWADAHFVKGDDIEVLLSEIQKGPKRA